MMNVDIEKWRDLNENLAKHEGMKLGEKFEDVYLVDDFTASGTTFMRQIDGKWKGKFKKFNDIVLGARRDLGPDFPIAEEYSLHIHHYVSSHQARKNLEDRLAAAANDWEEKAIGTYSITEGLILPEHLSLSNPDDSANLTQRPYFLVVTLRMTVSESWTTSFFKRAFSFRRITRERLMAVSLSLRVRSA